MKLYYRRHMVIYMVVSSIVFGIGAEKLYSILKYGVGSLYVSICMLLISTGLFLTAFFSTYDWYKTFDVKEIRKDSEDKKNE